VLWRASGGAIEIGLIATRGGARWQLPKGHLDENESEADAARREVREETGCDSVVEEDLGEIAYWFYAGSGATRKRVRKSVHFYLVRYEKGDTADHDAEVDDARFFASDEAMRQLSFDSEREILARGLSLLQKKLAGA
jgi:8-oxo-dGTP pyrophosphatase MutT (NUDIX family)